MRDEAGLSLQNRVGLRDSLRHGEKLGRHSSNRYYKWMNGDRILGRNDYSFHAIGSSAHLKRNKTEIWRCREISLQRQGFGGEVLLIEGVLQTIYILIHTCIHTYIHTYIHTVVSRVSHIISNYICIMYFSIISESTLRFSLFPQIAPPPSLRK